jgi:phytoene desaturase
MADYDVVVIGGGIGGLCIGALMAKEGRKTLVLEQGRRVGGFCSTVEHKGYHFDIGTSIIEMVDIYNRFFRLMGTSLEEEVDLIPLDPIYTYVLSDGTKLAYPALKTAVAEEFAKLCPRDAKSWFRYAEDMQEFIDEAVPAFFFAPMLTFRDLAGMFVRKPKLLKFLPLFGTSYQLVMEKYFRDPRILEALCFQANYTGLPPSLAPGIMSILPWNEHTGFYYCRGGLASVPGAVESLGKRAGMKLRTGARVKKVMVANNEARGVVLSDGTGITADVVVSDINAKTLYKDLVGLEHLPTLARKGVESLEISVSALMMFLGLDSAPPLESHHTIATVPVEELNTMHRTLFPRGRLPEKQFGLISWKTASDPGLAPKGHHAVVLTLCGPNRVAGADWDDIKEELTRSYVDYFDKKYLPGIKKHAKVALLGTPKDFERDLLAPGGGIYLFPQDLSHSTLFRPAAKSKSIERLYLVGASTHPGGGVPAAMASAVIAAKLIGKHEFRRKGN